MTSSVHRVLVSAKGHLLNRGWRQGQLGAPGAPLCMRGALFAAQDWEDFEASGGAPRAVKTFQVAAEAALCRALELANTTYALPDWNDMAGRSVDEVIDAFDRAILDEVRARPEFAPADGSLHAAAALHGRQP